MARSSRTATLTLVSTLFVGAAGQCQDHPSLDLLRRAVGTGAQGALAVPRQALMANAPSPANPSLAVPSGAVQGAGEQARFVPTPDAHHQQISVARQGSGWALGWTDGESSAVYFGRVDGAGRAAGAGVRVHAAVAEEESAAAPTVTASPDGAAMSWVDAANGRVWFARTDAAGAVQGRPVLVHEGLEAPRAVQLVWNGREFAAAVSLWRGVYFTRLSADGQRVGDAMVLAEGASVARVEGLRWDGRGFQLGWVEDRSGQTTRVQQRLDTNGRRVGDAVLGANDHARSRLTRRVF